MHESVSAHRRASDRAGLLGRLALRFEPGESSATPGAASALDPRTAQLVFASLLLYGVSMLVAIGFQRHLYGDAAWYLVRVLSENHVVSMESGFGPQFYRSRWFAYHFTQWPLLWASQLGVTDLTMLSWAYGGGMYVHRALSLIACWVWLKDKRLFLFPLASLFAGSIDAEVYIVSETHFLLSLVWPLLVLQLGVDLTPARRAWLVAIAVPTLMAYESMLLFGPLLMAAALLRVRLRAAQMSRADRALFVTLAIWFLLGTLCAIAATVWPRDPTNRGTFVSGIALAIEGGHVGIIASIAMTLVCPMVILLWPRARAACVALLSLPAAIALFYVARMLFMPDTVGFDTHVYARGMTMVTPVPLCAMFVAMAVVPIRRHTLLPCLRAVAVLGLCQCLWSLGATVLWANMVTALRLELARGNGVMAYESTALARRSVRGLPMERLHLTWPVLPMSLVLGGSSDVSSVIFAANYPFIPFDPRVPQAWPHLERYGVRVASLAQMSAPRPPASAGGASNGSTSTGSASTADAAVTAATPLVLDFKPGGNGVPLLGEGWANQAEDWARWSDGPHAVIRLPAIPGFERGGDLDLRIGAFVSAQHPRQRVTATLDGRVLGRFELTEAQVKNSPTIVRLSVPAGVVTAGQPSVLRFELPDARSPKQLGASEDARQLGIALVELTLRPKP